MVATFGAGMFSWAVSFCALLVVWLNQGVDASAVTHTTSVGRSGRAGSLRKHRRQQGGARRGEPYVSDLVALPPAFLAGDTENSSNERAKADGGTRHLKSATTNTTKKKKKKSSVSTTSTGTETAAKGRLAPKPNVQDEKPDCSSVTDCKQCWELKNLREGEASGADEEAESTCRWTHGLCEEVSQEEAGPFTVDMCVDDEEYVAKKTALSQRDEEEDEGGGAAAAAASDGGDSGSLVDNDDNDDRGGGRDDDDTADGKRDDGETDADANADAGDDEPADNEEEQGPNSELTQSAKEETIIKDPAPRSRPDDVPGTTGESSGADTSSAAEPEMTSKSAASQPAPSIYNDDESNVGPIIALAVFVLIVCGVAYRFWKARRPQVPHGDKGHDTKGTYQEVSKTEQDDDFFDDDDAEWGWDATSTSSMASGTTTELPTSHHKQSTSSGTVEGTMTRPHMRAKTSPAQPSRKPPTPTSAASTTATSIMGSSAAKKASPAPKLSLSKSGGKAGSGSLSPSSVSSSPAPAVSQPASKKPAPAKGLSLGATTATQKQAGAQPPSLVQKIAKLGSPKAAATKAPTPAPAEPDIFAEMGLSAKPKFTATSKPTLSGGSRWQQTAATAPKAPFSSAKPATVSVAATSIAAAAASATTDDDFGGANDDWGDDLDDLLDD